MSDWGGDLRYAVRGLMRTPVFTVGVLLTLALGIGVNALMFGVVDTLFLRAPVGVTDPSGVVRLFVREVQGADEWTQATTSYPAFKDMRDHVPAFTRTAAVSPGMLGYGRGVEASRVPVLFASHEYFPLLGVRPSMGRFFDSTDDVTGGPLVAVLSHAFWQRQFHGDSAVLGRTIPLGRTSYTVIGVAQPGFRGIDMKPVDLFLPILPAAAAGDAADPEAPGSRNYYWMRIIARLAPGVTAASAADIASPVYRRGAIADSPDDSSGSIVVGPLQEARGPNPADETRVALWLGLVALGVLLIACANVANLLLARGVTRAPELAIRASLGAGQGGMMRLLLSESLILALVGGGLAILVAIWGGVVVRQVLLPDLDPETPLLSLGVLAAMGGSVLVTAVVIGLLPALQAGRLSLGVQLRRQSRGAIGGGGRARSLLLATQVALTLVLLIGAGLFLRSLRNVQQIDVGVDTDRVLSVVPDFGTLGLDEAGNTRVTLELLDRLRRLDGVEYGAASMGSIFGMSYAGRLRAEGRDTMPRPRTGGPYYNAVTGDYFRTTGMKIVRGRGFEPSDEGTASKVAAVNESFAKAVWPDQDPIGKCLYIGEAGDCYSVIGVVGNSKRSRITEGENLLYYFPLGAHPEPDVSALYLRMKPGARGVPAAVRREIQAMNLPYAEMQTIAERMMPQLRSWRLGASVFTAFGLLALGIAATGIFAVLSYGVSQRTREIGVRVALGAQRPQVMRLVVGQGLRVTAIGMVVGLAGAWALARAMRSLLYGVSPLDPKVFLVTVVVLLGVAVVAALLPARRAARIDPMTALRAD